ALVRVELDLRSLSSREAEIGVGIGVIPDLVSLAIDPAQKRHVRVGVLADHEERCFDAARGERIEDRARPIRVRPVVEGEGDPMRMDLLRAEALDDVRGWIARESLPDDKTARGIDGDGTSTGHGLGANAEDLAFTVQLRIVARQ